MLRIFGHLSLRSEWQLIKVDYKSIFSRKCTKDDFQTWHLHNQTPFMKFDYGYERHSNNQCIPAFWFNPSSQLKECSLGQSYLNSTG
ncbi:hypothetical protein JD844_006879 [Phrynosoma platyrhinos]|uniref:Sortilin C-terminal domain-containing protein n=1 Tax=Phrynosoma platyrhinos TaxID=52577 RepID=A0ABQ7T2K1_PHRPL|nr:hypothetical protein JD844_006879 [Phrynosoma platyrhinos]